MKITINGSGQLGRPTIDGLVQHIVQAEADGFPTYWLAQAGLVEALSVFVAAAHQTTRIELGTAVVPTFQRHPTTLAGQALTAQAATNGRIALGIGLSHQPVIEDRLALRFERPVRHLVDYLDILQPLLTEGAADHHGDIWTAVAQSARPTDVAPPVLVAALGPQTLKVCGQRTDGTVLWLVGPKTIANHIAPRLHEAAESANRPTPRIVCSLPVVVTNDPVKARERAARAFRSYYDLPSYRAMLDREGVSGAEDVAVIGSEASVTEQLAALFEAGATEFSALEFGANPDDAARTRELLKSLNDS